MVVSSEISINSSMLFLLIQPNCHHVRHLFAIIVAGHDGRGSM